MNALIHMQVTIRIFIEMGLNTIGVTAAGELVFIGDSPDNNISMCMDKVSFKNEGDTKEKRDEIREILEEKAHKHGIKLKR